MTEPLRHTSPATSPATATSAAAEAADADGAARAMQAEPGARSDPTPPYAPRHLRVVESRRLSAAQRHRRPRMFLAAVVTLVVGVLFGLVYAHVIMAQKQFELDRLATQAAREQANYDRLRLQVAQLQSPQRIISMAEGTLGMRQPASLTYLTPAGPGASPASATPAGRTSTTAAPAGDADWPRIKSQLAGSP